MADLTPAGRAHAARLAGRVGREVVVQHEMLPVLTLERIDDLLVLTGAERGDDEGLGLPAGEQRRTVGARQHSDLGADRPHRLGVAAVDARIAPQDSAAHDLLLQLLEELAGEGLLRRIIGVFAKRQVLRCIELIRARLLVALAVGGVEMRAEHGAQLVLHRCLLGQRLGHAPRFLGAGLGQLDDRVDHRLKALMSEGDGAEHGLLGKLLSFQFDHQHAFLGAGHHQVELRALHVGGGRIEHVLAVDIADPSASDRPHERDPGNGQRRRGSNHGDDVGIILQIVTQHGADDLRLIEEARDEERADRPVDEAGDQRLLLRRAAFTLEEAARDLAGGEGLFLVVDGQRKEILAGALCLGGDRGAQHGRLAVGGEHRAIGLAGDPTSLQHEAASAPIQFLAVNLKHYRSSFANIGGSARRGGFPGVLPAFLVRLSGRVLRVV